MQIEVLDPEVLVFVIHDFLSVQECQAFIAYSESRGFAPAPLTTRSGPVMAPEVRNHTRVMVDNPGWAESLWARLRPLVPRRVLDWEDVECRPLGLNERFRFFRYEPGQRFTRHYDAPYTRGNGEVSLLSCVMYLNAGFEGGDTRFYTDSNRSRFAVHPRTGSALVYLHNQLNEDARVVRGRKYAVRTDVMVRRVLWKVEAGAPG